MTNVTTSIAEEIVAQIMGIRGQFTNVRFKSNVVLAAKFKHLSIEKITLATVRAGIDFKNLSSVKEGIENGERGEIHPLKWGSWKKFPYIIEHKGKEYVRLYPSLSKKHIPKVKYFLDGKEISKKDVLNYVTDSKRDEMIKAEKPECFNVTDSNFLPLK